MSTSPPNQTRIYLELKDRRVPVPAGTSTIGRSRRCEVVIPDPSISRSHALISVEGGRVTLKDLDSSNGTSINGERLRGEAELADGDLVCLGETEARLKIERPEEDFGAYTVRIPVAALDRRPAEDPLSASEAIGVGDVLPVGEVLARPSPSWDVTNPLVVPPPAAAAGASPAAPRRVPAAAPAAGASAEARPASPARAAGPPAATPAPPPGPKRIQPPAPPRPEAPAPAPPQPVKAAPPRPIAAGEPAAVAPAGPSSELLPSLEDLERQLGKAVAEPPPAERAPAPVPSPAFLPPAGFWVRVAAQLFDSLLVSVLGFGLSFAAGGPTDPTGASVGSLAALLLSILIPVVGWSVWATTPGKRLLGLYVCDREGRVGISLGRALLRWFGYFASALPLGLGFVLAGLNADHRALHDYIAGTYVGRRD